MMLIKDAQRKMIKFHKKLWYNWEDEGAIHNQAKIWHFQATTKMLTLSGNTAILFSPFKLQSYQTHR